MSNFTQNQALIDFQKNTDFPAPQGDLTGKVAIVTGSNAGLGYETVAHFIRMKASRIIMAVRSVSKGEKAKAELLERAGPDYKGTIDVWELDQASFDSVKAFAAKVDAELDRLDIAILNAGMMSATRKVTKDGWEEGLQVNAISTGLLALLLLPLMGKTAGIEGNDFKPHLDIVTSGVHAWAQLKTQDEPNILDAMNNKEAYDGQGRYDDTKLLDVFIVGGLTQLPAAKNVVVTSSNPGVCRSEFIREMPEEIIKFLRSIAWTAEKGARNFAYAAICNDPSGSYISECEAKPVGDFVTSEKGRQVQKKIWEELKSIWISIEPKVQSVL